MSIALIGTKLGMTREFLESGQSVPVTVIKIEKGRVLDVISKETRDTIMRQWSKKHPSYLFDSNFGYGTKNHINAILENGILDLHRKSFKPIATIYSKIN